MPFPRVSVLAKWLGTVTYSTWQPSSSGPRNALGMQWTVSACWHLTSDNEQRLCLRSPLWFWDAFMSSWGVLLYPLPYSPFSFVCEVCTYHQFLQPAWAATCGEQWRVQTILLEPHALLFWCFCCNMFSCNEDSVTSWAPVQEWHQTHWVQASAHCCLVLQQSQSFSKVDCNTLVAMLGMINTGNYIFILTERNTRASHLGDKNTVPWKSYLGSGLS